MAMSGDRGFDPRIWLLAIGTFAIGTEGFVIAGILPALADDLHVAIEATGLLVSVYALVYGLGTPFLAVLVARLPRHRVALISLGVFAFVNLLCALAPTYSVLLALRAVAGICAALYAPTAYAIASSLARPERRGGALAAVALGSSGSTVIGVPLGAFIGNHFGWRATFVFVAIITAAGLAAMLWRSLPVETDAHVPRQILVERFRPLARAKIWIVLLPALLLYCAIYLVYTYIAPLLETHYALETVPAFLVVYGLGGLAGSQLGGRLVDIYGATRPLLAALSLFTLLEVALPFSLSAVWATCATLAGLTLCSWACFAPIQTRAVAAEPANANVIFALINSSVFLGGALGAALGGVLLDLMPVTGLPLAAALLTGAAVAIIGASLPRELPRRA
jgi:MFS transporter, DHA1 family, inner membrane transport protein